MKSWDLVDFGKVTTQIRTVFINRIFWVSFLFRSYLVLQLSHYRFFKFLHFLWIFYLQNSLHQIHHFFLVPRKDHLQSALFSLVFRIQVCSLLNQQLSYSNISSWYRLHQNSFSLTVRLVYSCSFFQQQFHYFLWKIPFPLTSIKKSAVSLIIFEMDVCLHPY